jgi:hypothetical protein
MSDFETVRKKIRYIADDDMFCCQCCTHQKMNHIMGNHDGTDVYWCPKCGCLFTGTWNSGSYWVPDDWRFSE